MAANVYNDPKSLHFRLLELLPSDVLKKQAGKTAKTKEDSIHKIIGSHSETDIKSFFFSHMAICKQHVFLHVPDRKLDFTKMPSLSSLDHTLDLYRLERGGGFQEGYYLLLVTQSIISVAEESIMNLNFLLPIRVTLGKDLVKIHLVILERSTSMLRQEGVQIRHKMISEKQIVSNIVRLVETAGSVPIASLDVNRGIKFLWHKNIIDSPKVQAKSPKSTSQETMDGGLFIKREYPKYYAELIQKPLLNTVFHSVQSNHDLAEKFVCDPSYGRFSFTSYSGNSSIDNVIKLVLQHN